MTPAYDMLPMLYAPARGVEMVAKTYAPLLPLPSERSAWRAAARAAMAFWALAADDERISEEFRAVCAQNNTALQGMASHPAVA